MWSSLLIAMVTSLYAHGEHAFGIDLEGLWVASEMTTQPQPPEKSLESLTKSMFLPFLYDHTTYVPLLVFFWGQMAMVDARWVLIFCSTCSLENNPCYQISCITWDGTYLDIGATDTWDPYLIFELRNAGHLPTSWRGSRGDNSRRTSGLSLTSLIF